MSGNNEEGFTGYNDQQTWCEECHTMCTKPCTSHPVTTIIHDKTIQSHAHQTLPYRLVKLKKLQDRADKKHLYKVVPNGVIQVRTLFGPYMAPTVDNWPGDVENFHVMIYNQEEDSLTSLECRDQDVCNWMMFVRPATCKSEQNLVAYQHQGAVYYKSTKIIPPGHELKVWYSEAYGRLLNIPPLADDTTGDIVTEMGTESRDVEVDADKKDVDVIATDSNEKISNKRTQSNTKNRNRKHWLCLECREVFLSSHLYKVHNCTKIQKIETRSKKRKNFIEEKHIKTEILSDIDHRNDDDVEDDNQDYDDYHHEDGYHEEDYQEGQHADGDYLDTFKNDKEIDGDQAKEESKDKGKTKRPTKRRRKQIRHLDPKELHYCTLCDQAFKTARRLTKHNELEHQKDVIYKCTHEGCNKEYDNKVKLRRHSSVHNAVDAYECSYCQKLFHRSDHLTNHLQVHSEFSVTHKCMYEGCEKAYKTKFSYRVHVGFHHAEDGKLQCYVCKEDFPDTNSLIFHLKVHAGARSVKGDIERKHGCDKCSKRFYTPKDLRRHQIVHTGEKSFLCQICPQKFGRQDHLGRHVLKAHSSDKNDSSPFVVAKQTKSPAKKQASHEMVAGKTPTTMDSKVDGSYSNMVYDIIQQALMAQSETILDSPVPHANTATADAANVKQEKNIQEQQSGHVNENVPDKAAAHLGQLSAANARQDQHYVASMPRQNVPKDDMSSFPLYDQMLATLQETKKGETPVITLPQQPVADNTDLRDGTIIYLKENTENSTPTAYCCTVLPNGQVELRTLPAESTTHQATKPQLRQSVRRTLQLQAANQKQFSPQRANQQPSFVQASNQQPPPLQISNQQSQPLQIPNQQTIQVQVSNNQSIPLRATNQHPVQLQVTNQKPLQATNQQPVQLQVTNQEPLHIPLPNTLATTNQQQIQVQITNQLSHPLPKVNDQAIHVQVGNHQPTRSQIANQQPSMMPGANQQQQRTNQQSIQYVNSGYVTTTVPVVTTSQQRTVEQSAVTVQLSQTAPPAANNPTQPYILQTAATQNPAEEAESLRRQAEMILSAQSTNSTTQITLTNDQLAHLLAHPQKAPT